MENLDKDPFNGVSLTQVDFYLKSLRNVIGSQNARIDTLQRSVEKLQEEKKKLLTMNLSLLDQVNNLKESNNKMIHIGESRTKNDVSPSSPPVDPIFYNDSTAASRQPSFEETNDATNDSLPNVSLCVDEIGCEQTSSTQAEPRNTAVEDHGKEPDSSNTDVVSCSTLNETSNEGARRKEPAKKKYHCDVCGRGYTTRSNLNQHMKVHDESRGHKCDVCWRVFPSNAHLTAHYKTHTGEKPHACRVCGRRFARKVNCQSHEETHNEGKPYACGECDKKYKTRWQLNKHAIVHDESRVITCEKCGKKFQTNSEFKVHYRTHTGERPYPCDECDKRFTTKQTLTMHKQVHASERAHECHACGKRFKTKHQLYCHMKFHREPTHACRYCGKKFHTSSNMKSHERIHLK